MLNTAFVPDNRAVEQLIQRGDIHGEMTAITNAIINRATTYPLGSPDREALMQIAIQNAELTDQVARILQ
jgi:hypothetical protein